MRTMTIAVAVVAAMAFSAARAQPVPKQDDKANAAGGYSPGLGEIMTLQQMRHSKLWFAGKARNWGLADYEVDELKEGFEDVAKLFPKVNDVATAPVIEGITSKQIADLEKAVEAKDRTKFASAFDQLTAACNGCHQQTKHGFIAIQRPTALPYTNQVFAPTRNAEPAPGRHR
jgi:hypothetical protein